MIIYDDDGIGYSLIPSIQIAKTIRDVINDFWNYKSMEVNGVNYIAIVDAVEIIEKHIDINDGTNEEVQE